MNKLIAFTGLATCGKSTASQVLAERLNYTRMSFATPLRLMLGAVGLTAEQLYGRKTEIIPWLGKTPRELMQTLGTDWGRNMIHKEIWTLIAQNNIAKHCAEKKNGIVFDDCRFDNEARMINALGGIVIRVYRANTGTMGHASEAGVSDELIRGSITNCGERADFQKHVVNVCNAL